MNLRYPWLAVLVPLPTIFPALVSAADHSGCSAYSSALDEYQPGSTIAIKERFQISDGQYATFQNGRQLASSEAPDDSVPVCYLWTAKKSSQARMVQAHKNIIVGAPSKDLPQCIYDQTCRYVAFPLTDQDASADSRLSSLVCENRLAPVTIEDVKTAVGTNMEFKAACAKGSTLPQCLKLAEDDPNKMCREYAAAAALRKQRLASTGASPVKSGRSPASEGGATGVTSE